MTLRRRVVLTSLLAAIPAALIVLVAVERRRAEDMRLALARVAEAHLTESVRDQCQSDPQWFLAGPRTGRPSLAARQAPDADALLPRPSADELPFEVFAYNAQFSPTSTAGPRFPIEFRDAMRSSPPAEMMIGPWQSEAGEGLQIARLTGWTAGPCAVLLFRMEPVPGLARQRALMFAGFAGLIFATMMLAFAPTLLRVRRTSLAIGRAAKERYASVAPDSAKDEISAMAFVFNDAAREIHTRDEEIKDRREALRRHVEHTGERVAAPLARSEAGLAALATRADLPADARAEVRRLLRETHATNVRLENFVAAGQLRTGAEPLAREATDLRDVVRRVLARYGPIAESAGVTLTARIPAEPVPGKVHALVDRAFGNLLDNAIDYNGPDGTVDVTLVRGGTPDSFTITVTDTGRGVSDEEFKGLTAIRRFRGDEAWNRRPLAPGLGLAVAREIADRAGLDLELRRPPAGGFEASLATAT